MKKISQYYFQASSLITTGNMQSVITIFGNLAAAAFSALSIILISRKMGPTLFGEFSTAFALVLILNKLNHLGLSITAQNVLSTALKDKTKTNTLSRELFTLRIILTGVVLVIFLPLSPLLTKVLDISNPYLVPFAIVFGSSMVYFEYLMSLLQGIHRFYQAIFANMLQAIGKFLLAFAYVVVAPSFVITFVLYVAIPVVPLLFAKKLLPRWLTPLKISYSFKHMNEILAISKHTAITILAGAVIQNIGVLFVKGYLNSFDAGIFGGVSRIALLFSIIGVSLTQVLYPRVSQYKMKQDILSFIKKSIYLVMAAILCFIALIPFSQLLIVLVLGGEYISGTQALMFLLLGEFFFIATAPFSALFFSFEKEKYFSISGIGQLITTFVLNIMFIPMFGLVGAALASLLTKMAIFVFTILYAKSSYHEKFAK